MSTPYLKWRGGVALAATLLVAALFVTEVSASSHRESPYLSGDPAVDGTDVFAWVDEHDHEKVNLIVNYYPFQDPNGGPNFYNFDDDALYMMHIDNDGDARADITFQFEFKTEITNPNTALYNTGPIESLDDEDLNVRQRYKVLKITHDAPEGMEPSEGAVKDPIRINNNVYEDFGFHLAVPPPNIGPKSIPDYENLAAEAVHELGGDMKVFAGQRDDPFFIDVGALFDLLTIRQLPGNEGGGIDGLKGLNVNTIALQLPIDTLTQGDEDVIGVWTTSRRSQERVLQHDGKMPELSGEGVQVSRLGNPLVNEVVIPISRKGEFNASYPKDDAQFLQFVTSPEPAALLNALYGDVLEEIPTEGRNDLVAVFLTGIEGLNQPQNVVPSEMLRLNTSIAPSDEPNRLGVIGGDTSGYPNGRRLIDDVTDITLRAAACGYEIDPCSGLSPNDQLGDGVPENDMEFMDEFPYVATPHDGVNHEHHGVGTTEMAMAASIGGTLMIAGLAAGFVIHRRRQSNVLNEV